MVDFIIRTVGEAESKKATEDSVMQKYGKYLYYPLLASSELEHVYVKEEGMKGVYIKRNEQKET